MEAIFPVPKKAVIIKKTWRKHPVKEFQTKQLSFSFLRHLTGYGSFSVLLHGYKEIRSSDVVQLQLSNLCDVDVCREIKSGELKEKQTKAFKMKK